MKEPNFFEQLEILFPPPKINILKIIKSLSPQFEDRTVQYRLDEDYNLWITPNELGKALGYANPTSSINRIIFRHMGLIYMFLHKLEITSKPYSLRIINEEGVNIICLKSNLPLANDFLEWAKDFSKKVKEEKQVEENLQIKKTGILKKQFNDIPVEYILDKEGNPWITAEQLGTALGYSRPREGIVHIINRNKDLLSEFIAVLKLSTPGGNQDTTIINEHGADIICMKSNTPKAKEFVKWAAKIIADYRHGRLQPVQGVQPLQQLQQVSVVIDADFIREIDRLMGASYTKKYLQKVLTDKNTRVITARKV